MTKATEQKHTCFGISPTRWFNIAACNCPGCVSVLLIVSVKRSRDMFDRTEQIATTWTCLRIWIDWLQRPNRSYSRRIVPDIKYLYASDRDTHGNDTVMRFSRITDREMAKDCQKTASKRWIHEARINLRFRGEMDAQWKYFMRWNDFCKVDKLAMNTK